MKGSERTLLVGVALVGALVAVWFLLLAPKREEAAMLSDDVDAMRVEVESLEAVAASAEASREDFDGNYRRLVVTGKAVPDDPDTPSLLEQLMQLSEESDVSFESINLGAAETPAEAPAAPAPAPATGEDAAPSGEEAPQDPATDATATNIAATPAPATEVAAASMPIGASVGPAGLLVMPYDLIFTGDFFEIAEFFGRLDDLVEAGEGSLKVDGRLFTINGFTMAEGLEGYPQLTVTVSATTYLVPTGQSPGSSTTVPPSAGAPPAGEDSGAVGATPATVTAN